MKVDHDIVNYKPVRLTGKDVVDSLTVISAADAVVTMRGPTLARVEERVRQSVLVGWSRKSTDACTVGTVIVIVVLQNYYYSAVVLWIAGVLM